MIVHVDQNVLRLDVSVTNVEVAYVGQGSEHLIRVDFPEHIREVVVLFVVEAENFVERVWKVVHD